MKTLNISKILGAIPTKGGKKIKLRVESANGDLTTIVLPYELELDLVLPLQIASNAAAIGRGFKSVGCHRAMRPSRIRFLTDTAGISVMQLTFDHRNKLDILLPNKTIERLQSIALYNSAKQRARLAELEN